MGVSCSLRMLTSVYQCRKLRCISCTMAVRQRQGHALKSSRLGSSATSSCRARQSAPGMLTGMHLQRSRLSSVIVLQTWSSSTSCPPRVRRWNSDTDGPAAHVMERDAQQPSWPHRMKEGMPQNENTSLLQLRLEEQP